MELEGVVTIEVVIPATYEELERTWLVQIIVSFGNEATVSEVEFTTNPKTVCGCPGDTNAGVELLLEALDDTAFVDTASGDPNWFVAEL
ncbi:MAG: hypothetical protein JRN09_04210 [Nitrososphaerota archaeon]|nr:hypothetical protein [Nitrososphaerota archaeon]